jgi:long-subunit acyl-CoA synthetase (AMP-forming)
MSEPTGSRIGYATWGLVVLINGEDGLAGESPASPNVEIDPGQLAYVIYISGSTGHPKGVAVTNRDVIGLVSSVAPVSGCTAPAPESQRRCYL